MRAVLLFVVIYSVIFKNGFICAVSPQSVFFVGALIRSGAFPKDRKQSYVPLLRRGIINGAIYVMLGFIISVVLLSFTPTENRLHYLQLAYITVCLYFCFYSFILTMYKYKKAQTKLKLIATLCTLVPCIATISGISKASPEISTILLTIGTILLYIAISKTKRMS